MSSLLDWFKAKAKPEPSKPGRSVEPGQPAQRRRGSLEPSPNATVFQTPVTTTDSRAKVVAKRDETINEITFDATPAPEPKWCKHQFVIVGGGGRYCQNCSWQPDIPAKPATVEASRPSGSGIERLMRGIGRLR